MGDFFLDLRPPRQRVTAWAAEQLRYFPDISLWKLERPEFSLAIARSDAWELWGPSEGGTEEATVALAGRIALDSSEWGWAKSATGSGGLACKFIGRAYRERGLKGLAALNGNFTAIVYDPAARQLIIVTDRAGVAPAFLTTEPVVGAVVSSQPDLAAAATGASDDLDRTSLAEFLSSGKVSAPHTYYRSVKVLPAGSLHQITLDQEGEDVPALKSTQYFALAYRPENAVKAPELAEQLGEAFRSAMRRRAAPATGKSIVSLSGGLDSRMILAACPPESPVEAICFLDEENTETRIARRIAETRGVTLHLLRRTFDHYGNSAEAGVRISGGMAIFASNHFLGFRDEVRALGAGNLLTGCYCDYLFKGLALNRRIHPVWRTEKLAPFHPQWYRAFYRLETAAMRDVESRWMELFPVADRAMSEPLAIYRIEAARLFPLSYEPDNTQRVIPQRVMPWTVPIADNDVLDVYLRTPAPLKLNASMFSRMVEKVVGSDIARIPDSNTGAPVNAPRPRVIFELYRAAIRNRLGQKLRPRLATSGSWPNWQYYVTHSETIQRLWTSPPVEPASILTELLGSNPMAQPAQHWSGGRLELFLRVLTLKIWFDVRIRGSAQLDPANLDLSSAWKSSSQSSVGTPPIYSAAASSPSDNT